MFSELHDVCTSSLSQNSPSFDPDVQNTLPTDFMPKIFSFLYFSTGQLCFLYLNKFRRGTATRRRCLLTRVPVSWLCSLLLHRSHFPLIGKVFKNLNVKSFTKFIRRSAIFYSKEKLVFQLATPYKIRPATSAHIHASDTTH